MYCCKSKQVEITRQLSHLAWLPPSTLVFIIYVDPYTALAKQNSMATYLLPGPSLSIFGISPLYRASGLWW